MRCVELKRMRENVSPLRQRAAKARKRMRAVARWGVAQIYEAANEASQGDATASPQCTCALENLGKERRHKGHGAGSAEEEDPETKARARVCAHCAATINAAIEDAERTALERLQRPKADLAEAASVLQDAEDEYQSFKEWVLQQYEWSTGESVVVCKM